jgi:hypothetical protein
VACVPCNNTVFGPKFEGDDACKVILNCTTSILKYFAAEMVHYRLDYGTKFST